MTVLALGTISFDTINTTVGKLHDRPLTVSLDTRGPGTAAGALTLPCMLVPWA